MATRRRPERAAGGTDDRAGATDRSGRGLCALACLLLLLPFTAACSGEPAELSLPTPEEVAEYYDYRGELEVELSGNVVEVTAVQSSEELRRGGTIWARVGPYIFLFSGGTRDLFGDYPGVAAVRVITRSSGGDEVARAMLRRDELNDLAWRRMLNLAAHARRDGTERPSLLETLIRRGERHTEYRYDPDYVGSRR